MLQKIVGFNVFILHSCRCVESSDAGLEAEAVSGELQFWGLQQDHT